jgi:hypothetical protein
MPRRPVILPDAATVPLPAIHLRFCLLAANGGGTANLTCETGCGINFNILVSPDRSTFNMVDVSTVNPGNFLIGTAIHE